MNTTKTDETIKCLKSYFSTYSRPNVIVSDRETSFTSQKFKVFLDNNNIKHTKIATLSPQSNGQGERINRIPTQHQCCLKKPPKKRCPIGLTT